MSGQDKCGSTNRNKTIEKLGRLEEHLPFNRAMCTKEQWNWADGGALQRGWQFIDVSHVPTPAKISPSPAARLELMSLRKGSWSS